MYLTFNKLFLILHFISESLLKRKSGRASAGLALNSAYNMEQTLQKGFKVILYSVKCTQFFSENIGPLFSC